MKPQSKVFFLITLAFLFSVFQTPLSTATLNDTESNQTVISNPLVCLVGVSEYDTQEELASVREEMRELYDLFHFDCGYEVRASFTYDALYASNHKNLPKMRLSLGDLNQFLEKSYRELYQKSDYYDGLIFVFSGHGFSNEYNCPLIATSDCSLQEGNNGNKSKLVGCKYFDDVKNQLTKLKKGDLKEKFTTMPKIFFNFSCQSDPTQNLTKEVKNKFVFPKRTLPSAEEEAKCSSILEEKRYENLKLKGAKRVLMISSTLSGFATGTNAGLNIVKCLRTQFKKSLGQQDADKSLQDVLNHVCKSIKNNSCAPNISGAIIAGNFFFSTRRKSLLIQPIPISQNLSVISYFSPPYEYAVLAKHAYLEATKIDDSVFFDKYDLLQWKLLKREKIGESSFWKYLGVPSGYQYCIYKNRLKNNLSFLLRE